MTDEAAPAPAPDAVQPSQIINDTGTDPNAQGKGVHVPEAETPKEPTKLSTRDAIAKAFDDAETKSKAEADDKAKVAVEDAKAKVTEAETKEAAKPEKARGDDGKFAKAETPADEPVEAKADKGAAEKPATERAAPEESRQSEGRKYAEPPARFLPEARTKWANVPNEVKAEFHRVSEEFERELSEHKQFREAFQPFEELASQHDVKATDVARRYVAADRMLYSNFGQGVAMLARDYGHRPEQAIAAIIQAHGLSPQQYAQHVMQNPQVHQAPQHVSQPQQAHNAAPDPHVTALAQELNSLKSQLATAQVTPMLERFASEHPDYHALEPKIAEVLKSGVIEQLYGTGLSPEQKLTEAFRMAGGSLPSRSEPEPVQTHSDAATARPVDPDGQKSIKGAPTAGQTGQPKWVPKSNREALERAFASVR